MLTETEPDYCRPMLAARLPQVVTALVRMIYAAKLAALP